MNSIKVQFEDGYVTITSRYAVRKAKDMEWKYKFAKFIAGNKTLWVIFMWLTWRLLTDDEKDAMRKEFPKMKDIP